MADALSDVQKRFDKLVRDIISHINRIINKLKKEKENTMQIYRDEVHEYYLSRREAVQNRGAEFDTLAKEREAQIPAEKKGEFDELVTQINALREELEKLLEREMQIESGIALKIKDEPARIEKEIELMNSLLEYIKSHVKVGKLFSKGRLISPLNTEAIYQRITEVYNEVKSRETEEKAVKYYFEMKKEIEQKSEEILSKIKKLMAILGKEEKAVSPEARKQKGKAVKKAEKVLKREENYFMLFSDVLKKLREIAASNLPAEGKLKEAQALLKRLERYERREQWRASARKLDGKLKRLLKISSISPDEKQEIEKEVRELKIFEGDLLVETVRVLGEKIKKGVQAELVNWQEIIAIIDKIQKDIRAAIAVDERLDKFLESEKRGGIRGKVGAGLGAAGRGAGGALGNVRKLTQRGPTVSQAAGAVRGALGSVRKLTQRGPTVSQAIGAVGGAIGRLPNPLPSLRNWASSVGNTAKRLKDKIRRKQDTSQEQAEVVAEAETIEEVEVLSRTLFEVIRDFITGIKPSESAKLVALGNRLSKLQSRISAGLKRLRIPGLKRKEAEEAAAEVEEAAVEAGEVAEKIEKELSKWQQLRGWLSSRAPDINLRARLAGARKAVGGAIGRLPNPLPSLRKWASSVGNTAKRLKDKIRRKQDTSQEQAEVVAEAETIEEVEVLSRTLFEVIRDFITGIKPSESAKLVALGNRLSKLQSRVSAGLKRLRIPGLKRKEAEEAAAEVEEAAAEAGEVIGEVEKELSKWQQLRGWLGSRAPDINLGARLAGARGAVGGAIGRVIGRKQGTDRVLLEETKSILRQFMEGTISEDSAYRGLRGLVDQNPSLYLSDNLKKNRPDLLNNAFAWAANGVLPPLSHYRRRMTTAKDTKYTINEAVGIGFYSKRIGNIAKRLVDEEERKRRYISKHPPRV